MHPPSDQEHEETSGSRPPGELRTITWNLSRLLALGPLLCLWAWIYTDFLLVVGGVLAVSGGVAWIWITFLIQLLRPGRREEIRDAFERRVLLSPSLWKVLLGAALLLLVLTLVTSTLEVRSFHDDSDRSLRVHALGDSGDATPTREAVLPARSSSKFTFLGYGPYRVKLEGLPALEVRPGILWPRVLSVPDDFAKKPVLLLVPDSALSDYAKEVDLLELVVRRGGEVLVDGIPFDGRAVWLGCERDVAIPASIMSRWGSADPPWLPATDIDPRLTLSPGDELTIYLREPPNLVFGEEIRHVVQPPHGSRSFVHEIVLEMP